MTDNRVTPSKLPITEALLDQIEFNHRIVGRNEDGSLKTIAFTGNDWFLRDATMDGFCVRVTAKGMRFYAQRKLGGRPCLFQCGEWSKSGEKTSLTKARKTAEMALSKMRLGQDPNLEKKKAIAEVVRAREKAILTLGFVMERDAKNQAETDAPKTAKDRRDVAKWIEKMKIWRMPIHEVTEKHLNTMMGELKKERGDASSVKVWRYARAAWNRLPAGEVPSVDPFSEWMKSHTLPIIKRRQTSLPTEEKEGRDWLQSIAALRNAEGSRAFAHRVMADYILLSLCWGARKSEGCGMLIEHVDFAREFAVFRDTKNGRDHYFPLTPGCSAILRNRIEDNNKPRGLDVKKAQRGEPFFITPWLFPSRIRGKHLEIPTGALRVGDEVAGIKINMHDLRRTFAGDIAADVMVDADGRSTGNFGLVKVAMNHADIMSDVTQGYIMLKSRLKMLRPIYLAHERRVLTAAGLTHLLPVETKTTQTDLQALLEALKSNADNPEAMALIKAAISA